MEIPKYDSKSSLIKTQKGDKKMKLVAKVSFIHEENAEYLIRAFFSNLPKEIIDSCEIIEFICAPHLCKDEENEHEEISVEPGTEDTEEEASPEPEQEDAEEQTSVNSESEDAEEEVSAEPEQEDAEEQTSVNSESEDAEEEVSAEPEQAEEQTSVNSESEDAEEASSTESEPKEIEKTASVTPEPEAQVEESSKDVKQGKQKKCEVPELAEFAAKSESYATFVKNVATWLNLGKNYQFFVNLAEKVMLPAKGELLWKHCQSALGEEYSKSRQNMCTTKVAAKFKGSENEVTILKLLEAIIEYRTFDFQKESEQTGKMESAEETLTVENSAEESLKEPNLVAGKPVEEITIMSDILCFKEAVESVDKTQPIETRVKHVLTAMGVEKLEEKEQENILEIANVAVAVKEGVDLEDILFLTKIPQEDLLNARMSFAAFINNVVKEYAPDKQIKLVDFLKELKKGVRLEGEIEGITE